MQSEGGYYDPDVDIRLLSPGLEPTKVNLKPEDSPPPFNPPLSSSSSSFALSPEPGQTKGDQRDLGRHPGLGVSNRPKKRRKKRRKGQTRPSQGDAVLLSYLAPNRPDIARESAKRPLNSASQTESEDEESDMNGGGGVDDNEDNGKPKPKRKHDQQESSHVVQLQNTASAALSDGVMEDSLPGHTVFSASLAMHRVVNGVGKQRLMNHDEGIREAKPTDYQQSKPAIRSSYSPFSLKIAAPLSQTQIEGEDESITTSPALAKFAITPSDANPESTLPAMQKSPPRSASAHSPDGTQSLPSLQTTLRRIEDIPIGTAGGVSHFSANSGQSPSMGRSPYMPGNAGPPHRVFSQPSPASTKDVNNMSPPGYPSHSSYWRSTPSEGSLSAALPVSVASLTPTAPYPVAKDNGSPESANEPQLPQLPSGGLSTNGPPPTGAFKCTHQGCTASPFLTQYLLNSHANVHSSSRPHYCPVEKCPRSVTGQGFKRKNEMIRHGLVHKSPGYMCPFCADQQHKYPRPDNLQRHVRFHHPDKQRDDPELRFVLTMRSVDGGRSRRRRSGA